MVYNTNTYVEGIKNMELQEYIFIFAWFLAGFIHGIGGTGAAMVAVPIITSLMPSETLTPVACCIAVFISAHVAWNFRAHCIYPTLKTLLMGAVPGSFVGLGILIFIPTHAIQFLTGCVMVLFVLWQTLYKKSMQCSLETLPRTLLAGGCAGVLNTSISFGNPAISAYTLFVGYPPLQIIGITNVFSVFGYLFACITQAMAGLFTQEVLIWAAYGIPASMLGIALATPLTKRIAPLVFKRILLSIISVGGVLCLWRGIQHM